MLDSERDPNKTHQSAFLRPDSDEHKDPYSFGTGRIFLNQYIYLFVTSLCLTMVWLTPATLLHQKTFRALVGSFYDLKLLIQGSVIFEKDLIRLYELRQDQYPDQWSH